MAPTCAQTVSHYLVVENLGAGGMGVVHKAEDTRLHRFVTPRFLPDKFAREPQAVSFPTRDPSCILIESPQHLGIHDSPSWQTMKFRNRVTLKLRMEGQLHLSFW